MAEIRIGNRTIGPGRPPFIVAEAGINHNGDVNLAKTMILAAKEAGADAVKFGMFKAEEFVGDPNLTYTYVSQGREVTESMLGMFKRCEFSAEEWRTVRDACLENGITFFSTAQNRSDLDLLVELGVELVKVGSDDLTNLPMLRSFAKTKLPIVISTGMANLADVHLALEALGALEGYPVVLLHCTSEYPTPPEDVNLSRMQTLSAAFPMVPVGFSDHTTGLLAASLATVLGACYMEKHFTTDHGLPGPDHLFSADPRQLGEWVTSIRSSFNMLGSSVVRPTEKEKEMMRLARRSVVALKTIQLGETLTHENVGLRRPGNGLAPSMLDMVVGKKAARSLSAGDLLRHGDFV